MAWFKKGGDAGTAFARPRQAGVPNTAPAVIGPRGGGSAFDAPAQVPVDRTEPHPSREPTFDGSDSTQRSTRDTPSRTAESSASNESRQAPPIAPSAPTPRLIRISDSPRSAELNIASLEEFKERFGECVPFTGNVVLDAGFESWMAAKAIALTTLGDPSVTVLAYLANVRGVVMLSQLRSFLKNANGQVIECTITAQLLQQLQELTRNASATSKAGGAKSHTAETTIYDSQFYEIVEHAINLNTSDMHFRMRHEGGEDIGRILFRVDGELELITDEIEPKHLHELIAAAHAKSDNKSLAKGEGQFNILRPLSSFIRIPELRNVELRFQSAPERYGFDVVIRVLNFDGKIADYGDIDMLGYLPEQVEMMKEYGHGPGGAVLFVGETGSGKTTALNTLVASHPGVRGGTVYASTLEDPPEGRPPNVSQFAVARSAEQGGTGDDNPFVAGLRVRMRSDGDIIVIGEIRDGATSEMFAQLGMSGHKVFGSLHAASCKGAYERLTSKLMGMTFEAVSSEDTMGLTVFQKLAPKLCPHCRIPAHKGWTSEIEQIKLNRLSAMGLDEASLYIRNHDGCEHCRHGRKGVQVIAELYAPDDQQRIMIAQGRLGEAFRLWRASRKDAFTEPGIHGKTAFEVALYFVGQGVIGVDTLDSTIGRILTYEEVPNNG